MQERQHVDPDWRDEPFYKNRYPDRVEFNGEVLVYSDTSMWKVNDSDLATWQNAAADSDEVVRHQRFNPILDYGAPNLLDASWQEAASMNPTHNGSVAGESDEWHSMQQVLTS